MTGGQKAPERRAMTNLGKVEDLYKRLNLVDDLVYYAGKTNTCANDLDEKGAWRYYEEMEAVAEIASGCGYDVAISISRPGYSVEVVSIMVDGKPVFEKMEPEHILDKLDRTTNIETAIKKIMETYDRSVVTGKRCSLYVNPDTGTFYMVDGEAIPDEARAGRDLKMCSYRAEAGSEKRAAEERIVTDRMETVYGELEKWKSASKQPEKKHREHRGR